MVRNRGSFHFAPPGLPVETRGSDDLHAALSTESRTRGPREQREVWANTVTA
jgi:hypothetical protein